MGKEFERIWSSYDMKGDATKFQSSDMCFFRVCLCPFR